jgi:indolepyruvate ferredoxin oxidoreductase
LAAVAWGRAAVARPDIVAAALASTGGDDTASAPDPATRTIPNDLEPDAAWPKPWRGAVRLRVAELIDFQNARVAGEYLRRVDDVAQRERAATGDPDRPITAAFARSLYNLTAIKDEYEVARLHLLDEEQQAFARAFPGARAVYLLKPPLLARFGLHRKIKLVRAARPAFRALRAGRRLRGTAFDVFGWTAERREERTFLADYLGWVAVALDHLTPATADAVAAVVDAANDVHGYAHVRQAAMARARERAAAALAPLTGAGQDQRADYPVAR